MMIITIMGTDKGTMVKVAFPNDAGVFSVSQGDHQQIDLVDHMIMPLDVALRLADILVTLQSDPDQTP